METNRGDVEIIFSTPDGWPQDDFARQTSSGKNDRNRSPGNSKAVAFTDVEQASPIPDVPTGLGPIDLDDSSLLSDYSDYSDSEGQADSHHVTANGVIAKKDLHNIPGSPWAKPGARHTHRPTEPLSLAKWSSQAGFFITVLWVVYLFIVALWNYSSVGRIIVEIFLALLTFLGLFWNTYFTTSSVFKCFIPSKNFKQNGKYFSFIPEKKHQDDDWLPVTIQVPVYKESLEEVLGPTLESCIAARAHYESNTGASCNIVVCDDGMMSFLRDNFSAAEMLWENVNDSKGRVPIKLLLQRIPRAARRHLSGLRSKNIKEVFNRMLFYYHNKIGFVARSTLDRRGKFKKASNINTHLRLVFGAQQITEESGKNFDDSLLEVAHNDDGSRDIMFGNNVVIGDLIIINDADARMSAPVIMKTVPEFLNDKRLGFTQHSTKTLDDQRGESCYLNLIEVYTDMLYQGHFLLSSIIGCHPPLVGHSIFLRTQAVRQCGRMRMLRKAQRWLNNIGLPFIGVDNVGFSNLQSENRTEYWSESHVSEDFELMIHLYNIGYTGRYIAFPDCEFQEGVTRTFDEEAGRHRKFALGGHELMFNPFQDWFGHGILTPIFKTFLTCDIPSYYKIFLTSYLLSYTSGSIYIIVFTITAVARLLDAATPQELGSLSAFSPASVMIVNIVIYYVVGYTCFIIATCRMHYNNKDLFFPQYRKRGCLYLVWKELRYCMTFQFLFYSVMGNYFFLGGMDHLMSKSRVIGATNKDPLTVSCFTALGDIFAFNIGSWTIALLLALLALAVVWQDLNYTFDGQELISTIPSTQSLLFAGPTIVMSIAALLVPIIMNPYVWGCYRRSKPKPKKETKMDTTGVVGSIDTKVHSPKGVSTKALPSIKNAQPQKLSTKTSSTANKPIRKSTGKSVPRDRLQSV